MMKQIVTICVLSVSAVVCAQDEVRLTSSRKYPHAGASVALPVGFSTQTISADYEIVRSSRVRGRTATQSVTLSAFPIRKDVTAEKFSQVLLENLKQDLATRHLKDVGRSTGKIGNLDAVVRELSYTYRGDEISAMGGVCVRVVGEGDEAFSVAYVLTVEVGQEYRKNLAGLFKAVAGSVQFSDIVRPVDMKIEKGSVYLKDFKARIALRVPEGWTGRKSEMGLFAGLADYTLDGIYSPSVQVVSILVEGESTPEEFGNRVLEKEKKQGAAIKVLEKEAVKVADQEGYQYVLQRKPQVPESQPAEETPPRPVLEIRRVFNIKTSGKGKQRHCAIIMTVHNCNPAKAMKIMDKVADGFSLLPSL